MTFLINARLIPYNVLFSLMYCASPICVCRHLFAIANASYTKMMDAKENQCIIIR